ncbi:hypothetical protein THF1C08_300046 [Vibrio jasicida]|uniref:Uncharacterized protein n=1 Tax=Vibrio jasicida TaxID=766224 RepID=A0AAU9QMS6_9VIBR|nr:hypothetical protein THF1C08_300046 [Vibrio jasicida]CAH1594688.1 hypothetical protein THF1A12_290047 [Vibrio jasicida]
MSLMWHIGTVLSMRGHRIMAITSAFQADDAGSIPAARSKLSLQLVFFSDFQNYSLNSYFTAFMLRL